MKYTQTIGMVVLAAMALCMGGCQSIPQAQLKNYALIASRTSDSGQYMDAPGVSGMQSAAYISYVNGRPRFPPAPSIDVLPGEYVVQLGLNCGNSATCRRGPQIDIVAEAGKRYVLTPSGVMVSDRFSSRANEVRYLSPVH